MNNPNVHINITANQTNKKHSKRRTFSTGYKKYVCMRIRNNNERVAAVAEDEGLIVSLIYTWLEIYDTTGFDAPEPVADVGNVQSSNPSNVEVQSKTEKALLETIEQLTKQVVNLTQEFTAFKHKLAVLAA